MTFHTYNVYFFHYPWWCVEARPIYVVLSSIQLFVHQSCANGLTFHVFTGSVAELAYKPSFTERREIKNKHFT